MNTKIAAVSLLLLFGAGAAIAQLQFRPMNVKLSPQGRNSSATFNVSNAGTEPIAVRIQVLTREVAEDGREARKSVEKGYFSLFPSSMVVEAGQARSVRLTWRGPSQIDRELAYRILAEQVPVVFAPPRPSSQTSQVDIDILFRYLGALYVTPEQAEPRIAARVERSGEANRANIIIDNLGTAHAVLHDLQITLAGARDGQPVLYQIDTEQLDGISNVNMLAGSRRVHPVTLPSDFPDGAISVDMHFEIF